MEKDTLLRFGVSMPKDLIEQFDQWTAEVGYDNRSEAIRDLIRNALLEPNRIQSDQIVAGTIVMVYEHHISELPLYLMELQHQYHHEIISNMHIHLDHRQCLEILVVRGHNAKLRELSQCIQVQKGVLYAQLSVTHIDEPHAAAHRHE